VPEPTPRPAPKPADAFRGVPLGLRAERIVQAPARRSLRFVLQPPRQTQWSWAAIAAGVAAFFHDAHWSQCRIVNATLDRRTCCSGGSSADCNRPASLDAALGRIGRLGRVADAPLSFSQIAAELDAGRPVGVRIAWSGGGAHVVAISGYAAPGLLEVQDPWFGRVVVDHAAFRSRYQGTGRWTHSYRTVPGGDGSDGASTRQPAVQRV
jgi:hypothetical protein